MQLPIDVLMSVKNFTDKKVPELHWQSIRISKRSSKAVKEIMEVLNCRPFSNFSYMSTLKAETCFKFTKHIGLTAQMNIIHLAGRTVT